MDFFSFIHGGGNPSQYPYNIRWVNGPVEKHGSPIFEGEQLTAGAGADLGEVVLACVKKELSGIEALTGIPGSIGGAVKMNAGGSFGDFGAAIETVTLMDSQGKIFDGC